MANQKHTGDVEFGRRSIEIAFLNPDEGFAGHADELFETAEAMQHAANRLWLGETYARDGDVHAIVKGTQVMLSMANALRRAAASEKA